LFCYVFVAQLLPPFTAGPINLFPVLEGDNITLVWSYDLGVESFARVEFDQFDTSGQTPSATQIVEVGSIGQTPSRLNSAYRGRIQVDVTLTKTSITILKANRTIDSKNYQFILLRSVSTDRTALTISVQCK